jgi:hypothetical protein
MEGTLLVNEPEAIRFRDTYGVQYTLKKDLLNLPAMSDANLETVRPPAPAKPESRMNASTIVHGRKRSLAEIARETRKNRTGSAPVIRNTRPRAVMPSWPKTSPELDNWIADSEHQLLRLAARCRSAGANPSAKHAFHQETYMVDGKAVVVSGYWADPQEIQSAREICTEAMLLEKALGLARKDLSALQQPS